MGTSSDKAAALLALHAGRGFVLPNAWDAGSARILEQAGFPAVATTSAGIAWSCGLPDGGGLDRDTMLEHIGRIVAAVGVPVTADLEAGYGDTPADVARTVARAVELGAVGGNLEDADNGQLFGLDEATDRVAAARAAASRGTFVLNARTDTYFAGTSGDTFTETVERAIRYLEAGADCVFVPGVVEEDTVRQLAAAIPGPLNIVAGLANLINVPTHPRLPRRRDLLPRPPRTLRPVIAIRPKRGRAIRGSSGCWARRYPCRGRTTMSSRWPASRGSRL